MSVIAVFPLKRGDSMFVGFDSQNTSHSFPHYPNWILWVLRIPIVGFRDDSENEGIDVEKSDHSVSLSPL